MTSTPADPTGGPKPAPEVRLATLDDAPSMLRVLEAAFDPWPSFEVGVGGLDHLRWKMTMPGQPAAHTVGLVNGEIAAVSLRWVSRMRLGDEELIQDSSVDHAVHPDFQGRGLGGAIARFAHAKAEAYSDVSLGTGSSDDRIPSIFDSFDPSRVTHVLPVRSRAFGVRAFIGSHRRGGGLPGLARNVARALQQQVSTAGQRGEPSGVRIEELTAFDERVDPLWRAFGSRFEFTVERDVDYLNWRYCDPRGGTAVVLAAFEGDQMVAFTVFKAAGDWSNVLDFAVLPDHPRAAALTRELLDAGCRRMEEAGARGARLALGMRHPAGRVVEAAGFLPAGSSIEFSSGPQRRGSRAPLLDRLYAGEARSNLLLGDADIF